MAEQSNAPKPDGAALVDIYRRMLRVERNDDAIRKTIRRGRLTMPYYSARGQEVIPATIGHLLNDEDQICTIYRGIQDMVAKDMPLRPLLARNGLGYALRSAAARSWPLMRGMITSVISRWIGP